MKNNKPIIKTFIYNGNYYMYDAISNSLYMLSKELYSELKILEDVGFDDYSKSQRETKNFNDVKMLIRKGVIGKSCIEKIEHPETEYIGSLITRCVNDITLQVTRDCNFNCRYCTFASNNDIGRNHEHINMSWEIARKSIDFLYDHSLDATTVTIGFYGGEPLINFKLIKYSRVCRKNFLF